MKRTYLIHFCMACTNALWHIKFIKSKSKWKQNVALLLLILNLALVIIYPLYLLGTHVWEPSSSSDGENTFMLPMVIGEYGFWLCIILSFITFCFQLRKLSRIVVILTRYVDASTKSSASPWDAMAFISIMSIKMIKLIVIIKHIINSVYYCNGMNIVTSIERFWTYSIELTGDVIPVILAIYSNFLSEIIFDVVHQLTTFPVRQDSIDMHNRNEKLVLVSEGIISKGLPPNGMTNLRLTKLLKRRLANLSDYLKILYQLSSWILLFSIIKSTFRLISLVFVTFFIHSYDKRFYFFSTTSESFINFLVMLNIPERLADQVSTMSCNV